MKEHIRLDKIKVGKGVDQFILPGYEDEVADLLNENKRRILETFFTNVDGPVTAIRGNMPPVMAAALTARFSRAQEFDITELFWREFIEGSELGGLLAISSAGGRQDYEEILASDHARVVVRRILDQFGDDSVREQASGYVMVQGASVLTSMEAFRHPLITGIEASTRYINFAEVPADEFAVMPDAISKDKSAHRLYQDTMRFAQQSYKDLWPVIWDHVVQKNPQGEIKDTPYKTAIKGAVCDALRGLLPLGVRTNFGVHTDYRAMTELIMNLRADGLEGTVKVADAMAVELAKVNPEFVTMVDSGHGRAWTDYQRNLARSEYRFKSELGDRKLSVDVEVLNANWEGDLKNSLGTSDLGSYLEMAGNLRGNRRHKLDEAFDVVSMRVMINNISFGAFKDLNRHRKLQFKTRPDWSGKLGYVTPDIIKEIGGETQLRYEQVLKRFENAKNQLEVNFPHESRLLLAHGMRTSYESVIGLGELYWMAELRSIASGNPEYREIAQKLYRGMVEKIPVMKQLKTYVDEKDYALNRIGEAIAVDNKISK